MSSWLILSFRRPEGFKTCLISIEDRICKFFLTNRSAVSELVAVQFSQMDVDVHIPEVKNKLEAAGFRGFFD